MNTIDFSRFHSCLTHDGVFHADEVTARVLVERAGFKGDFIRSRNATILETSLHDPNTLVLDCGMKLDPAMGNFDHHQDRTAPHATAGLIWNEVRDQLYPNDPITQAFVGEVISAIDAVDLGRENAYITLGSELIARGYRSISAMVSGFNRPDWGSEGQDVQFQMAMQVIENEIYAAEQRAKAEKEYINREILDNNVAVFESFNPIWKEKGDHQLAIMPYTTPRQWQIVSADSAKWPLPEESVLKTLVGDDLIFRHQSGFMATFKSKDAALTVAKAL